MVVARTHGSSHTPPSVHCFACRSSCGVAQVKDSQNSSTLAQLKFQAQDSMLASLRVAPGERLSDSIGDVPLLLNPNERDITRAKLTLGAENALTEIFHRYSVDNVLHKDAMVTMFLDCGATSENVLDSRMNGIFSRHATDAAGRMTLRGVLQ